MCGTKRGSCRWINFSFYPSWRYKHEYLYRIMEFITRICDSKSHPEATYQHLTSHHPSGYLDSHILRYIKWRKNRQPNDQLKIKIFSLSLSIFWLAFDAVLNVQDCVPGWSVVWGCYLTMCQQCDGALKQWHLSLDCVRLTRSLAWLDITFRAQTQLAPVNE